MYLVEQEAVKSTSSTVPSNQGARTIVTEFFIRPLYADELIQILLTGSAEMV